MANKKRSYVPKLDKNDVIGGILFEEKKLTRHFLKKEGEWNTPKELIKRLQRVVENTTDEQAKVRAKKAIILLEKIDPEAILGEIRRLEIYNNIVV